MKYRVEIVRFNMRIPAGSTAAEWYNGIERSKMLMLVEYQNKKALVDWKIVLGAINENGYIMPVEDLVMLTTYEEDDNSPWGRIKEFSDNDAARLYYEMYESDLFDS